MDIVHHTLIGGAGLVAASAADVPLLGVAFVAGSVFPDLDVFFMALGKRFYLRNHQAITHSLPLSPLYAALIAGGLSLLLMPDWSWPLFFAALAGILLHVGLDWSNTFRISLFAPFSKQRYSADAVFFIDTVTLALTGMFYLTYAIWGMHPGLWCYPAFFAAYLFGKLWLRRQIQRRLDPVFAIPSSLNPLQFYILEANGTTLVGYLYNALTGAKTQRREYAPVDDASLRLAQTSVLFNDMTRITRALRITEVHKDETGTTLRAEDVAVRNFGGHFGKTVLRFDREGRLLSEVANI